MIRFPGILLLLIPVILNAQNNNQFALIRPVEDGKGENPLMELVPDSTAVYGAAEHAISETFMGQSIALYHMAQNFLVNTGQLENREPAYLAITQNQGGFAKKGFKLRTPQGILDKSHAPYIDLTEGSVEAPLDRLMSITQLYPHELGHVMYRMMSATDSIEQEGKSVTVHYFSLVTDNSVAFNEGFAEHIENIARLYEKNDSIRNGIDKGVAEKEPHLQAAAEAFVRDFTWPFRLEYYKVSMIAWYQQYEDFKRYKQALEGKVVYRNDHPELAEVADMISVRNAGVMQKQERRNKAELMASEGFVSAYFSRLAVLGLGKAYREPDFYRQFLKDTSEVISNPADYFNEVENLFAKYFYAMNKHVQFEKTEKAHLIDFIDGYVMEFPEDADLINEAYVELNGENYNSNYPASLWLMAKDYQHRILALDAYGAATLPVYTFNANNADPIDFLTIKGVDKPSADKIVEYRNINGYFNSIQAILDVPGISQGAKDGINASSFDESFLEGLDIEDLDIGPLISVPLVNLLKTASIIFVIIFLTSFITLLRKTSKGPNLILTVLKYYLLWIMLVIAGLATIIFQGNPVTLFLAIATLYSMVGLLILRNKLSSMKHFILITAMMFLVIIYSLM